MRQHLKTAKEVLQESPYGMIAFAAAAVFLVMNLWLLTRVTTITTFFSMAWAGDYFSDFPETVARIFSTAYAFFYWLITIASVLVFGISTAFLAWLFQRSRFNRLRGSGLSFLGVVSSMFASGCPICGAFLFLLVGVSGGLSLFPLKGMELKFLSLGLMVGSTLFFSKSIQALRGKQCDSCDTDKRTPEFDLDFDNRRESFQDPKKAVALRWTRRLIWAVSFFLAVNQFLIASFMPRGAGAKSPGFLVSLFSAQSRGAKEIIATRINPDGRTTSVVKQPTITEVPAEPKGMSALEAAQVVMIARGAPFYAPAGISFDDPLGALAAWQKYEKEIKLSGDLEARWQKITGTMTCDYCCGSPTRVTAINRCGCRHAGAYRSIAKYLLANYGDKYTDDEILGELQRWKGVWYPKGTIEDYLLATGRGDVAGHQTHGGAGADGRHGF